MSQEYIQGQPDAEMDKVKGRTLDNHMCECEPSQPVLDEVLFRLPFTEPSTRYSPYVMR